MRHSARSVTRHIGEVLGRTARDGEEQEVHESSGIDLENEVGHSTQGRDKADKLVPHGQRDLTRWKPQVSDEHLFD